MDGQMCPIVTEAGRTLVIGSTGFIGRFVTDACLDSGLPTYVLVRSGPISSSRDSVIKSFQEKGATIVHGSINDQELMANVLTEHKIEYVISAVGGDSILDQINLLNSIKEVGTIKRFLPSEFGHDIDRADPVEPGLTMYVEKRRVRRCIEEAGIPYTYICCNSIAAWPYHDNTHPADVLPPLDQFHIYGDGSVKAYFVAGTDIGKFTVKALKDDRTLNKMVHFQPPSNLLSINELASLWEAKMGLKLPRVTITEDNLLVAAAEMRIPESIVASFTHDIFIKGCQLFPVAKPNEVEVGSLYPGAPFKTIDECFTDFAAKIAADNPKTIEKAKTVTENPKTVEKAKIATENPKIVDASLSGNGIMIPTKHEALITA